MSVHTKTTRLPKPPKFFEQSPLVVQVLDNIRYQIYQSDKYEELGEFTWFAREYPRIYRYHLNHAQHRLKEIYNKYLLINEELEETFSKPSKPKSPTSITSEITFLIYWDFECYLNTINCALDTLARIVGPAFNDQTPISFNKICNKNNLGGPVDILRKAKSKWVNRLKDYRDCFVHYTPVDNTVCVSLEKYSDGWEIRAKLPTNPNARNIEGFRFSRRVELLKYSFTIYRHMVALDHAIAKSIKSLYLSGAYPKKTNDLFFIGQRTRQFLRRYHDRSNNQDVRVCLL